MANYYLQFAQMEKLSELKYYTKQLTNTFLFFFFLTKNLVHLTFRQTGFLHRKILHSMNSYISVF